ncbi:MAG: phasin family protein [Alphaproteobacteria bacterium]|nr:MAG: phasin family protein [Alphaproteobacteria bacterium]
MTAKKTTTKKITKKATPKVEKTVTASTKNVQDFWTEGFEKAKDTWGKALNGAPEISEFHKENVNAIIASATAAGDSIEKIANESIAFHQKSFEDGVAAVNQAAGATTLQDAFEIQSTFAKSAFEAYSAHLNKIGEIWGAGAKQSFAPISGRFGDVFEGFRS